MQVLLKSRRSGTFGVPSTCALCYGTCSILVHRVDRTAIKIEGNRTALSARGAVR
jgi:hypothetical protein